MGFLKAEVMPNAEDLQYIGSINNPSILNIEKFQSWNGSFNAGEDGQLHFNFGWFPNFSKEYVAKTIDGLLESKGVSIWKPSVFNSNTLEVNFTSGAVPLIVIAIIIGGLVAFGIAISQVSLYKLNKIKLQNSETRITQTLNSALDVIEDLPEDQKLEAYSNLMQSEQKSVEKASSSGIFDKPLQTVAVFVGLSIVAIAVFFGMSKR